MIGSGTTTHITPPENKISQMQKSDMSITLPGEAAVQATHCNVRRVSFMFDDGQQKLNLSKSRLVPQASKSLTFVPALTREGLSVFLYPVLLSCTT